MVGESLPFFLPGRTIYKLQVTIGEKYEVRGTKDETIYKLQEIVNIII